MERMFADGPRVRATRYGLRAAGQGFEPRFLGPEPSVLPLDDPARNRLIRIVGRRAGEVEASVCRKRDTRCVKHLTDAGARPGEDTRGPSEGYERAGDRKLPPVRLSGTVLRRLAR